MCSASQSCFWRSGRCRRGGRIALAVLSAFWLWNGIVYHLMFFLQINFAALGFAALFMLQALLLAGSAIGGRRQLRLGNDNWP